MHVSIKWFNTQFNVLLASKEGAEPFLEVKGCRIANGKNGEFVSWPSTKKDDGKYWNHCYASEKFAAHVLELAKAGVPQEAPRSSKPAAVDHSDDIPF